MASRVTSTSPNAAHRNVALTAGPLAPRSASLSGPVTAIVPNAAPAAATSQPGTAMSGLPTADSSSRNRVGAPRPDAGRSPIPIARIPKSPASTVKTNDSEVSSATPPTTGPSTPPSEAAASPLLSILARCPAGATSASHENEPDQASVPAMPWRNRVASSRARCLPYAIPRLPAATSASESSTVVRAPSRATSIPAGTDPAIEPAAYSATKTPASAWDIPKSAA